MSSDLQNKLFHFETDPPKEVWDKITDALDADTAEFPQRLFQYEEQPPATIWSKIEAGLEETEPAIKVVPITRFKKPVRYIAAAASIVAVIFLATLFTNKKTGTASVINGPETVTTNQSSILPLDKPAVVEDTNQSATNTASLSLSTDEEEKDTQVRKRSLASILPRNILHSISFSKDFIPRIAEKKELLDFSELNKYMVYSDGEGMTMKMPKKLFSLVNCKDGDDSCKERIKRLQQTMATSMATTDFGGVLEILHQLQ